MITQDLKKHDISSRKFQLSHFRRAKVSLDQVVIFHFMQWTYFKILQKMYLIPIKRCALNCK